jgi:hypothetical protein
LQLVKIRLQHTIQVGVLLQLTLLLGQLVRALLQLTTLVKVLPQHIVLAVALVSPQPQPGVHLKLPPLRGIQLKVLLQRSTPVAAQLLAIQQLGTPLSLP